MDRGAWMGYSPWGWKRAGHDWGTEHKVYTVIIWYVCAEVFTPIALKRVHAGCQPQGRAWLPTVTWCHHPPLRQRTHFPGPSSLGSSGLGRLQKRNMHQALLSQLPSCAPDGQKSRATCCHVSLVSWLSAHIPSGGGVFAVHAICGMLQHVRQAENIRKPHPRSHQLHYILDLMKTNVYHKQVTTQDSGW